MEKEDTAEQREATHRKVVAILDSDRESWWQAERIVGWMCGYEHIAGQKQDAGDDRPFDLRSPGDLIRIDVKTQQGNQLDVKKEKPGKQFAAWNGTARRFIPLQLVLDSLSEGWYVVPGIPLRTADVILDPLVTEFDAKEPTSPFLIGRCRLPQLNSRERFDVMVAKLEEALEVVEEKRAEIQAAVSEEHLRYVASVAEDALVDTVLMSALVGKMATSKEAMSQIAQSEEAMHRLAQSHAAMSNLAQSQAAMRRLAQSDQAMRNLGQSEEAMSHFANSEEAMSKLAHLEEAIANLMKAARKDPTMRAKLLALLEETGADESAS